MNETQLMALFREKGYKVTPQRLAICEEVLSSKEHPSAESIFEKVSKKHPGLSLTTVYHTLDLLKELDLLHELRFENRSSRFDPNTSIHVNVICQKCGMIEDYDSDSIQKKWRDLVSEIDVEPIGQRLDVYTVCESCKE